MLVNLVAFFAFLNIFFMHIPYFFFKFLIYSSDCSFQSRCKYLKKIDNFNLKITYHSFYEDIMPMILLFIYSIMI